MRRIPLAVALLGLVTVSLPALAKKKADGQGTAVKVVVTDPEGKPIPTAVVRHPDEADRHRVNAVDGSWEASILYLPDGSELIFAPGLTLRLEVSAPGYNTMMLQYDVRKRSNKIPVELTPLQLETETYEEPVLQFGRDNPREGSEAAPAN
jgi:hypothetical protein